MCSSMIDLLAVNHSPNISYYFLVSCKYSYSSIILCHICYLYFWSFFLFDCISYDVINGTTSKLF